MILIVDDDHALVAALCALLRRAGYDTAAAYDPLQAVDFLRHNKPQLVLMDMNFSLNIRGDEGLTLLRQSKIFQPSVPVILMTAWGNIDLAVAGIKAGASDFVTKPWDNRRLLASIESAISIDGCDDMHEGRYEAAFSGIIGRSEAIRNVLDTVRRIAPTDAPVLITGESGTGKELIAQAIHKLSRRSQAPFVKVNLGGMPASLFESEMFGYIRGAFTGAVSDRRGRFEAADRGTIFLDEIGELDLTSQVKMLRVLQEQTFEPLGSNHTRHVDVRIVCATNADLPAMVAAHTFREDLFYRINLVTVHMPPLRNRGGDIDLLAQHFLRQMAAQLKVKVSPQITPDGLEWLRTRTFPGNVRQLKNIMERAALLNPGANITAKMLGHEEDTNIELSAQMATLDQLERSRIEQALRDSAGNISAAAAALGISRPALYRRMEKYGL